MYCLSCGEVYNDSHCRNLLSLSVGLSGQGQLVSLSVHCLLLSLCVGLPIVCFSYLGMPIPRYLLSLKEIKVLHCKTFMKLFKLFR